VCARLSHSFARGQPTPARDIKLVRGWYSHQLEEVGLRRREPSVVIIAIGVGVDGDRRSARASGHTLTDQDQTTSTDTLFAHENAFLKYRQH
jgi:hypothetical protein